MTFLTWPELAKIFYYEYQGFLNDQVSMDADNWEDLPQFERDAFTEALKRLAHKHKAIQLTNLDELANP